LYVLLNIGVNDDITILSNIPPVLGEENFSLLISLHNGEADKHAHEFADF
jgi:hypothetical protein